ncbi:MAG TPA: hypothetical protein VIF43_00560 [Patescibacteria group bacterium]|jgi:hypothetical protein
MPRIDAVRGFFSKKNEAEKDKEGPDPLRRMIGTIKDRAGRSEVLVRISKEAPVYLKYAGIPVIALLGLVLMLLGHIPLVLTVTGLGLILYRKYLWAALPLFVLGVLGMFGYVLEVGSGGMSEDVDNGFFMAALGISVMLGAVAYLLREDRPAILLAGLLGFLEWVALQALSLSDYSNLFYVVVFLALVGVAFVAILLFSETWDSAAVAAIGLAAFHALWLLLSSGSGTNFDTLGDGRFEQFLCGGLLVLLAATLLLVPQRTGTKDKSEEETEETEERPVDEPPEDEPPARVFAMPPASDEEPPLAEPEHAIEPSPPEPAVTRSPGVDYGYVEDQPAAIQRIWATLTDEQRELIPELLHWQLYRGPAANGSDRYNEALDPGLRERAERCGLTPQQFAGIAGSKAATILAAHADRDGKIPDGVWHEPGSGPRILDRLMGGLNRFVGDRYKIEKAQPEPDGIRPAILTELHITPREVVEAHQRLAYG